MNVATLDLDTVKLIPKKLVMEQEEEMTIFHIIDRQLVYRTYLHICNMVYRTKIAPG